MRHLVRPAFAALAVLLAWGCQQPPGTLEDRVAAAAIASTTGELLQAVSGPVRKTRGERRRKKRRWSDSPVFVDGTFVGMLKYGELPPSLPTRVKRFEGDSFKVARRFSWNQYFRALGVDVSAIEAVHFYGGRDMVCVVEGDELRRVGDTFQFSFTRGTSGFPRLETPEGGIRYNTYVDKLRGVAVYVKKKAPTVDARDRVIMPDGTVVTKGFPYAEGQRHGGTRVYLDGALVGVFHRRALDAEGKRTSFRLDETLVAMGVDRGQVRRVQIVAGRREQLVADGTMDAAADWTMGLPRQSRGRVRVAGSDQPATAVLLYARSRPADRRLPHDASELGKIGSSTLHAVGGFNDDFEVEPAAHVVPGLHVPSRDGR